MERKFYPIAAVVVMVGFFSALFMADATTSQAASPKGKTAVSKTSVERAESRITQLKGALKITEDQEVLWTDVTQVMRDNAKEMDALSAERAQSVKGMNAVERLKFHSQITQAQLDQQKKFIPPFEALYASLSDAQKATADSIFRTGRHGKNGKHKIE